MLNNFNLSNGLFHILECNNSGLRSQESGVRMFEKFVNYQIGIFAVRLNRIYAPYKRLFHILECQESGVRSQESECSRN